MRLFPRIDGQIDGRDRTTVLAPPFDLDFSSSGIPMPTNIAATTYPAFAVAGVTLGTISKIDETQYRHTDVQSIYGPVEVSLTSPYANSEIRYTLNGKNPSNTSPLYTSPLSFRQNGSGSDNTVVKARIYDKANSNNKSKIIRLEFRVRQVS